MKESVSVVVMAYNEEATLRAAVDVVLEALEGRYEVIIVDDGSTDNTKEIADKLATELPLVRVVHHSTNRGFGGIYRTSFAEVQNDLLYFMAADCQPIPSLYFEQFLPLFDEYDIVLGRLPKRRDPFLSKFFSWAEKQVFHTLFPGVPKVEGPFMFRRSLLDNVKLALVDSNDRSWMILWELFIRAHRQGYKITTVKTRRRQRAHGKSRGNTWANVFVMIRSLIALCRVLRA